MHIINFLDYKEKEGKIKTKRRGWGEESKEGEGRD